MAYDEGVAQRLQEILTGQKGLVDKKMFGGVGFMLDGNMAVGVYKEELIVRVGLDKYEEVVIRPFTRPFDITGRPMKGWVMVGPEGYDSDESLAEWVEMGVTFARSLPPK